MQPTQCVGIPQDWELVLELLQILVLPLVILLFLILMVVYTDGYCHWVRAESEAKAKKEIESRSGRSWKQILKGRWVIYKAHPKTRISEESGGLVYPNGHPPIKIEGSDHYRNSEYNQRD